VSSLPPHLPLLFSLANINRIKYRALEYYQLAAAQGNPAALCNLGILYAHGRGVEKDRGKAAR